MSKRPVRRFLPWLLVVPVVAGGFWLREQFQPRVSVAVVAVRDGPLEVEWTATGYVEARVAQVAAPQVGRIVSVGVREGDPVKAGQELGRLTLTAEKASIAALDQAAVASGADAAAAQGAVGEFDKTLPDRIRRAQADAAAARSAIREFNRTQGDRVNRAEAEVGAAQARLRQAQSALESNRRVANANLAAARAQAEAVQAQLADLESGARAEEISQAEAQVASAKATAQRARSEKTRQDQLFRDRAVGKRAVEDAQEALDVAQATLDRSQAALELLRKGSRPQEVAAARSRLQQANQQAAAAEAQLAGLDADERKVEEAQAGVKSAQAAAAETRSAREEQQSLKDKATAAEAAAAEARAGVARRTALAQQAKAAEARVKQTKSSSQEARAGMAERTLIAPFDGKVGRRFVDPGTLASPSQTLFTVVEAQRPWIAAEVDVQDLGKVRLKQRVTITSPAYPGRTFQGLVSVIGSQAVPQTEIRTGARIVRVRVSVDNIPPGDRALLTAGMDVDVSSRTAIAAKALLIPADAVLTDSEGPYVYVIEEGNAWKRRVKTGYSTGRETEILTGLKAQDKVAITAKEELQDGTRVSVQEAS